MIFKNKLSKTAMFTFDNSVRKAFNWCYSTEDKEEIKFLQNNPAWEEVRQKKEVIQDAKKDEEIKETGE